MINASYPYLMDLFRHRYSCRDFAQTPIDPDLITAVLDAARLAPSAKNIQPTTFIVVTNPEARQEILAKSRPAFMQAPVVIVACGDHDASWHRPADGKDHTDVDTAIAVTYLTLAATSLGLATCWVCSFDTEATRRAMHLPPHIEPIALIPIGYAASDQQVPEKIRKPLDQTVKCENF